MDKIGVVLTSILVVIGGLMIYGVSLSVICKGDVLY